MENFPGWTVSFELLFRQEQSRHASGRTRVKDFGTPIWTATYQSRQMRPNELDQWRARLSALGNGLGTFRAWPLSRCYPIAHPNSPGLSAGEVGTVGSNNMSLSILWDDDPVTLSVGDYIEINSNRLHQITNVATGPIYSVAPHFSVGILAGQSVNVIRPGVLMALVPGSINTQSSINGRGSISFQAMEARG
jgi:hypothetical protein